MSTQSDFDPAQRVGETVTVRGTAWDARAGAIVELADGTPIYIAGLESWDAACSGKEVEVSGLLLERPSRMPKVPSSGEQSHGLAGATFVLHNATWTVLS